MDSSNQREIKSVEEVFQDFQRRREGLIKALTTDVDKLIEKCDPEKETLCLYGRPNGSWEVDMPEEEVPPEYPEPVLGINFARDGISVKDWLSIVAVHSDVWLISCAFYFGARFGFDKHDRKKLFKMINELPTLFEVITQEKLNELSINSDKNQAKESGKPQSSDPPKKDGENDEKEEQEDDDKEQEREANEQEGDSFCGACGVKYVKDEFWICCDVCEKWYHGHCVKVTPAKAKHIKYYKCPDCTAKTGRLHY